MCGFTIQHLPTVKLADSGQTWRARPYKLLSTQSIHFSAGIYIGFSIQTVFFCTAATESEPKFLAFGTGMCFATLVTLQSSSSPNVSIFHLNSSAQWLYLQSFVRHAMLPRNGFLFKGCVTQSTCPHITQCLIQFLVDEEFKR
mmetsp:Transcript_13315/g.22214  ORF Transcript_13315/g.22214 Transcript_13315/m.22214 type:complete len:143 (-) Transcript_13315:745-1173(-)